MSVLKRVGLLFIRGLGMNNIALNDPIRSRRQAAEAGLVKRSATRTLIINIPVHWSVTR